jgi:uncharacterized repeat protein (TIGR04138 family)
MQALPYEHAIEAIVKRDPRFHPAAYIFLKEALDHTLKKVMESNQGRARHVSGAELLLGFRELALQQFGPMASTLLSEWGIHQCSDVGDMVFLLIEEQVFGKQDSDTKEDFSDVYSFEQAFVAPFLPQSTSNLSPRS